MSDLPALIERMLEQARAAGSDDTEVLLSESTRFSTRVRQGVIEAMTEATVRGIHLRVFVGQRLARASTSDLRDEVLATLLKRAVERARLSSRDPFAGLPEEYPVSIIEGLDLYDPELESMSVDDKVQLACKTERIGLALEPRVRNSGGAGFTSNLAQVWLANSHGFRGHYRGSSCSLGLHLLGKELSGDAQVSDYWYTASRHLMKLDSPEQVARITVERVRRHFGARKVSTQEVPVVFEPVVAAELLSDLFGAVTGEAVYRRRSFLANAREQKVAAEDVTLVDDGLLPGGLGTRPFDVEGVASQRTVVIEKGRLRNYLCGCYSAKKLGGKSTGNGAGNGEAPTNFYLDAGTYPTQAIVRSVPRGLYVTRLIGQGVNLVTGDYSRGAFGLWIEQGQLTYPVHEITVSGNLRQILEGVEMIGCDLEFRDQFAAPTIKVSSMTVSGT